MNWAFLVGGQQCYSQYSMYVVMYKICRLGTYSEEIESRMPKGLKTSREEIVISVKKRPPPFLAGLITYSSIQVVKIAK